MAGTLLRLAGHDRRRRCASPRVRAAGPRRGRSRRPLRLCRRRVRAGRRLRRGLELLDLAHRRQHRARRRRGQLSFAVVPALADVPGARRARRRGSALGADPGQLRQRARGGRRPGGDRLPQAGAAARRHRVTAFVVVGGPAGCRAAAARRGPEPSAINGAAALTLWAMLGVECASIAARRVRDPGRNVPRATLIGTFIVGLIYILVSTPVAMLLPQDEVARSNGADRPVRQPLLEPQPRPDGRPVRRGQRIGALNGFVLLQGEMPLRDGARRRLPRLVRQDHRAGIPVRAQILSSLFATALIAANYSRSLAGLFTFMILLATSATLVLYLACALAALRLQQTRALPFSARAHRRRRARRALFGLDALRRRQRRDQMGRGAARDRHRGLRGDARSSPAPARRRRRLQPRLRNQPPELPARSSCRQTSLRPSGPGV